MNSLYILIGLLVFAIEYMDGVDTNNIIDKIAHGTLFLGCIAAYDNGSQAVFMVGVILTLGATIKKSYRTHNARSSDKVDA
jgi:uncharacterized membrane protein YecN with MAPEG domain